MANDDVKRLRAELKRRREAVSNKISRIKREHGAQIAGSNFDPRRRAGVEKSYNKRQLQHHIAELNQFMSRGNQFVGGAGGAPIKRSTWETLSRRNREEIAIGDAHFQGMANIPAPLMGQVNKGEKGATIGQTRSMLHPTADGGVKGPYSNTLLEPSQIAGENAAQTLAKDALNKLKAGYLGSKISEGRENVKKALEIMGESGLMTQLDKLTDSQFDVLWFGSAFAEITFMKYDVEQARAAGSPKEEWQNKVVDNAFDDIGTFLDWASDLPQDGKETRKTSREK